jgi:hypothetical protein
MENQKVFHLFSISIPLISVIQRHQNLQIILHHFYCCSALLQTKRSQTKEDGGRHQWEADKVWTDYQAIK